MEMTNLTALTPQQVNSWPVPTPDTSIAGEKFNYFGSKDRDSFLRLMMERFDICKNAESDQRSEMLEDQQFAAGQQWQKDIEQMRRAQQRPCLTINRIDGFLAHAVNNMRQSRPSIKIEPAADGADEDVATLKQGLVRHIQLNSNAETVYDEAFRGMCTMGLSWMRVVDDWSSPESFDQDLFIRWVKNPFCVYHDPFCSQPDWSDMKFAFVVEDLTRQEFIAKYGKDTETASLENFQSVGDHMEDWFPGGRIRTVEYFHVEQRKDTLCEMEDGTTRLYSKLPKGMYSVSMDERGDLATFLNGDNEDRTYVGRARDCMVPEVYWAKCTAKEVLKERKWKGRYIPLIPVIGNMMDVDGKVALVGMVRYAREPQRMYNYMYTSFVETVALAPRAPFIAEIDQIPDGVAEMWKQANTLLQSVLLYKATVAENGQLVPAPVRQQAEPPIQAFVSGLAMADSNLKSVFRIFDASLGQKGPQESGLAINARKIESDTGIYNWGDNFIRSLRFLGMILEDLMEYYYNTPGRVFEITQDDDSTKQMIVNQEFQEQGQTKKLDLSAGGKYRTVVSTGPSQQTKRQESAQGMIDFFKLYPAGLQACAHILVNEMDFPGKDKLRAQLEKILPPNLQAEDPNAPPIPPVFQAQAQEMQKQIGMLSQALHEATDKVNLEKLKQDREDARKDREEQWETLRTQMQQEVQLALGQMKTGSDELKLLAQQAFNEMQSWRDTLQQHLLTQGQAEIQSMTPPAQPSSEAVPPTSGG
jgi:hypothetical protein